MLSKDTLQQRFRREDYIKHQVDLSRKPKHYNICLDCNLYDLIKAECLVTRDNKFQCWNDDTHNGVVQQFIFIKK